MQEIVERLERIEAALAAPKRAYLGTAEAAQFLGMSTHQLEIWRMKREGPAFYKVGKSVRYAVVDLHAYMDGLRKEPLNG